MLTRAPSRRITAFTEVVDADLAYQVSTAATRFKTLLDDAVEVWDDNKTKLKFTASEVKENQDALKDFAAKAATYISYNTADMTK